MTVTENIFKLNKIFWDVWLLYFTLELYGNITSIHFIMWLLQPLLRELSFKVKVEIFSDNLMITQYDGPQFNTLCFIINSKKIQLC